MKKFVCTFSTSMLAMGIIMGCTVDNRGGNAQSEIKSPAAETVAAQPDSALPEVQPVAEEKPEQVSGFGIYEISDEIFNRIKGKSYKDNCIVPVEDLRYLTIPHYTLEGTVAEGELICNKAIAEDLIDIFKNLYAARYPIEKMVLIDEYDADDRASMTDNNTSCFNFRVVAGSTKLSNHALGLAIDVNPRYNPYVTKNKDGSLYVSPKNGKKYADRKADYPYKIDENDLLYKEFMAHGFNWGGAWKTMKDYQHFEKKIPDLKY